MEGRNNVIVLLSILLVTVYTVNSTILSQTFKPPFSPDGRSIAIGPGWEIKDATIVMEDHIRLTPNENGRAGLITNNKGIPTKTVKTLDITLSFRIHSQSKRGADGLALWLTDEMPQETGQAYGFPDTWTGIGIVVDTFSNSGVSSTPQILLLNNDGRTKFDASNDGYSLTLASCTADIRNSYSNSALLISIVDSKISIKADVKGNIVNCIQDIPVTLPTRSFISISAATGGLNDYHDVESLLVYAEYPENYIQARRKENQASSDSEAILPNHSDFEEEDALLEEKIRSRFSADEEERKTFFDVTDIQNLRKEEMEKNFPKDNWGDADEGATSDDDEDIIGNLASLKSSFNKQVQDLQTHFNRQLVELQSLIPPTITQYNKLKDNFREMESNSVRISNEISRLGKDVQNIKSTTDISNQIITVITNAELQISTIEANLNEVHRTLQRLQQEQQLEMEALRMEKDAPPFFAFLLSLLIPLCLVVCLISICFYGCKAVLKPAPRTARPL